MRFYYLDIDDEAEYRAYRLTVKQRLNQNHYKLKNNIEKLEKRNYDTTHIKTTLPNLEERLVALDEEYKVIEFQHNVVATALKNYDD